MKITNYILKLQIEKNEDSNMFCQSKEKQNQLLKKNYYFEKYKNGYKYTNILQITRYRFLTQSESMNPSSFPKPAQPSYIYTRLRLRAQIENLKRQKRRAVSETKVISKLLKVLNDSLKINLERN